MLNKKKNLLQRVRIMIVAIVALLGIGGAFAMKAPEHKAATTWGVVSTDANYYYVTASAGNCSLAPSQTYKILSEATPDSQDRIPKADATVSQEGSFSQ